MRPLPPERGTLGTGFLAARSSSSACADQQELSWRSEARPATIKRIEAAGSALTGTARTQHRIQKALEAAAPMPSMSIIWITIEEQP